MKRDPNPIITLDFHRKTGAGSLHAEIGAPYITAKKAKDGDRELTYWECDLMISFNGVAKAEKVQGANCLQPLLIAVDIIRQKIPENEAADWLSEEGHESWSVLPKMVPIAWGHSLFSKVSQVIDDLEKDHIEELERQRKTRGRR
jgi:hypothetical protein